MGGITHHIILAFFSGVTKDWRERGREGERKGGRTKGREEEREGGRKGERRERERGREGERKGEEGRGREGGRKGGRERERMDDTNTKMLPTVYQNQLRKRSRGCQTRWLGYLHSFHSRVYQTLLVLSGCGTWWEAASLR